MKIILAGNKRQYDEYCRGNQLHPSNKHCMYARNRECIMGLDISDYAIVGTFWDRPDSFEIMAVVLERLSRNNTQLP
jgi:hypothetical protein